MVMWRPIEDTDYEVSSSGLVRNTSTGKILKPSIDRVGYSRVRVDGRSGGQRSVHRIVAEYFIGPCPDGKEVNHKNGNKQSNGYENLEYVTHFDNIQHSVLSGLHPRGEKNGKSRLSKDIIEVAVRLINRGWSIRASERALDIGHGTMNAVLHCRTWRHLLTP